MMPRFRTAPVYQKESSTRAGVALDGRDQDLGTYGRPESIVRYEGLVHRRHADRL
jgi:hypothetical protein